MANAAAASTLPFHPRDFDEARDFIMIDSRSGEPGWHMLVVGVDDDATSRVCVALSGKPVRGPSDDAALTSNIHRVCTCFTIDDGRRVLLCRVRRRPGVDLHEAMHRHAVQGALAVVFFVGEARDAAALLADLQTSTFGPTVDTPPSSVKDSHSSGSGGPPPPVSTDRSSSATDGESSSSSDATDQSSAATGASESSSSGDATDQSSAATGASESSSSSDATDQSSSAATGAVDSRRRATRVANAFVFVHVRHPGVSHQSPGDDSSEQPLNQLAFEHIVDIQSLADDDDARAARQALLEALDNVQPVVWPPS